MKINIKRSVQVVLSILILGCAFGLGFLFASESGVTDRVTAAENADLSTFWKVWSILDEKYVSVKGEDDNTEKRVEGAIKGMVESLGDPYTTYFDQEELKEFESDINGSFDGVGMEVGIKEDLIKVVSPLKDSPAERAGIQAGDTIIAINGTSTKGMGIEKAVSLIRGKRGTEVTLTLSREGKSFDVSIIRAQINMPTIETEIRGDTFIISLSSFSSQAPSKFRSALKEFLSSKKKSLIIDLRGNPGGYLEAAVDIASWFLPVGKVVAIEDFGEGKEAKIFRSKGYNVIDEKYTVAVLVNKGSASASEILAGALRDHKKAVIVGEDTFGKGSVQELVSVTDDTSLKITVARWLTPNEESISDGGLKPDILIEITDEDIAKAKDGEDIMLEKALKAIK